MSTLIKTIAYFDIPTNKFICKSDARYLPLDLSERDRQYATVAQSEPPPMIPRKINGALDAASAIFEPQLLQENTLVVSEAVYENKDFKPFSYNIDNNIPTSSDTINERNRQLTSIKIQDTVINGKDAFNGIYGHASTKNVIKMALKSIKPVHVLLVSPPGMGKTQFLLAIRNAFKHESCFVIGSNSTKKGIADLLFEKRPQILLIDELETMSYDTQESLLNLMETGIISETKKTCTRDATAEHQGICDFK